MHSLIERQKVSNSYCSKPRFYRSPVPCIVSSFLINCQHFCNMTFGAEKKNTKTFSNDFKMSVKTTFCGFCGSCAFWLFDSILIIHVYPKFSKKLWWKNYTHLLSMTKSEKSGGCSKKNHLTKRPKNAIPTKRKRNAKNRV